MVILGISIGTRTSGIAIINNRGLIEWRTLSFKNSWSEKKADYIVRKYERYVEHHMVTIVALKIPPPTHQTRAIIAMLEKLITMLTYHGCMVEYNTKTQIKKALPGVRNSKHIMEYTANLYPSLIPKHTRELRNRNKYHERMFEAVLVAHLHKSKPK